MHTISIPSDRVRTDLVLEQDIKKIDIKKRVKDDIIIEETRLKNELYTTIKWEDITDKDCFIKVREVIEEELEKYLSTNPKEKFLIIGLGNEKSTPDSLGPKTIDKILVTRYLYTLGEVEEGYRSVASFTPNVMGNTGIETSDIIKSLLETIEVDTVIIIDALKTNNLNRLGKTIQITTSGISPGSGIGNTRKEISKATTGVNTIAIGVPTTLSLEEKEYMVTPTNIDFLIEKLSLLVSESINHSIHPIIRQNKS